MALSPLGEVVERECHRISEFTPEIGVLGVCVMPDHLHLVLQVKRPTRTLLTAMFEACIR